MSRDSFGKICVRSAVVAVLVFGALALVACGSTPTSSGASGSDTSTTTAGSDTAAKPLDLAIGQTANYADTGLKVTVVSAGAGPNDYSGKATYKITVKYENTGKESISFNIWDWQLEDANGARTNDIAILSSGPATLSSSGELAPGGSVSGDIYLSPGPSVAKIVYSPSFFSGEDNLATWVAQ
ncbi:MAG: DUF4352 domain-containing protein [Coriobacteriia bacterium]